jgi:protein-disulfide isomerase
MSKEHRGPGREQLRFVMDVVVTIVLVVAAGLVVWNNWPRKATEARPVPKAPVSIVNDATLGDQAAKIVVIEYSDFQCPFCGRFAVDTFPGIRARLIDSRQLRWVFKHLPLEKLHPDAVRAAEAAECGRRQNRFWQLHDQFFAQPKQLSQDAIMSVATNAGLDMTAFSACLGGQARADVLAAVREAKDLRITSTPTFLVGVLTEPATVKVSQRLDGIVSLEDVEAAIALAVTPTRTIWPWWALGIALLVVAGAALQWRRRQMKRPIIASQLE